MSCTRKPPERSVVLQAREFRGDDADVFGALGNLEAGQFLDRERIRPVVRQRTKIIEPVGIRHRAEIGRALANFFVIAMQVAEDRLQLHDLLAIEHDVHAEHTVRGRVLRPHGNFEQFAFDRAGVTRLRANDIIR